MNNPHARTHAATTGALTFQGYLRVLRQQWRVIVTILVVAVIAAIAVMALRPPEYTARLTLYVAAQPSGPEDSALQAGQLAQQRVTSYKELVTSTRVTGAVITRLGLDTAPADLAEHISAASPPDSVLVQLAVTGRSSESAEAVANALGAVMIDLAADLETPAATLAQAPVALRIVDQAKATETSPGTALTLAVGVLIGLVVAVATALARNALDTSVRTPERLRDAADAPILATIAFDRQARQRPLTVQRDPRASMAETFRQLRTKLRFLDVGKSSKVYMISSALPYEGKTTTLTNLAIALGATGARTLIIEADLRQPRSAALLGLDPSVGMTSVALGEVTAKEAVQRWRPGGLDILASGPIPPNPGELLAATDLPALLRKLRPQYDIVLIDTPPVLPVSDAVDIASCVDGIILVCRYGKTRQDSVRAAVDALHAVSARVVGTVLTMAPSSETINYTRPKARRRWRQSWHRTHSRLREFVADTTADRQNDTSDAQDAARRV